MSNNMPIKLKTSKAVGAMLGAACGDALGWPNERIDKTKVSEQTQGSLQEFREWSRHSGGRFFRHEETIKAGEYSDDTQLILCLSRSLPKGTRWLDYFTHIELPFWSCYERGGGKATKRAVASWVDGVSPWNAKRKPQDVKQYFNAGGNGVAMRVLPHVLYLSERNFPEVALNIFLDGITTHGHPRALLGALVYGFALWSTLGKDSNLAYGELIEEVFENEAVWSIVPRNSQIPSEWWEQAEKHMENYQNIWVATKDEILEYLTVSRSGLSKGALSFDDDVLEKIKCFDKKISGAGTVAAISAVYLASRYAADPLNGVIKAAFTIGSDTDTIASMTGGLLGCINGTDWLSSIKNGVQDSGYLEKSALKLISGKNEQESSFNPTKGSFLKKWINDIATAPAASETSLPDGRKARVNWESDRIGSSGKYKIEFRRITSEDGQTIYIKKTSKGDFRSKRPLATAAYSQKRSESQSQQEKLNFGPKLLVSSIEKSTQFYQQLLGLSIKKEPRGAVVFNEGLVLAPASYTKEFESEKFRALIYVEVADIKNKHSRISKKNVYEATRLERWEKSKRRFFRCVDPDGNLVEVFENANST